MKKHILLIILSLITSASMAQKAMQPADLFKFGRIGNESVSPNGNFIIYTVTKYDIEANQGTRSLILYNRSDKSSKELVSDEYNPSQIAFTIDGEKVGFLSSKGGSDQLWEIPLSGGEPEQITKIEEGISLFLYDPSGKNLLIGRRIKMDKEAKEQYKEFPKTEGRIINGLLYRHWNQWGDYSFNHIFITPYKSEGKLIDLLEGEKYHTPTMPFGGVEELNFSSDGKKVYYTCKKLYGTPAANSTNTDIYEYTIATGKTENITKENKGYDKVPQSSSNGKYLAWTSMERAGNESDKNRIILHDLKTATHVDLTDNFKYSVDGFVWSSDDSKIYFICAINATHQIFSVDIKSKVITQLTKGIHDYTSLTTITSGKSESLLAARMSISSPKGLYIINTIGDDKSVEQIDNVNAELLKSIKMGRVEQRMIPSTDSQEILTWIIYPPNFDKNKKYPTLLYCQGGPQSPVSQFFSYRWNFQMMAAKGYIVVAPNRRGLPGFGQEWNDEISHDYGGQAMKDLLSAIDFMAKEPFVDKDRLGAVGASFGGYSVYWLAGNHNNRFKAFISHCGMFNMESWYGSTEEMFFANNDNGPYWMEQNKENYKKHSPHQYVANWNTPILVIHNELDFRVPLSEGMQAFTAAQQKMIPSKFLYFPDEGHWVNKPQNALLWQTVFFEWLDQWLK